MKEFIFSKFAGIQFITTKSYTLAQVIFRGFESLEQLFCRTLSALV